MDLYGADAWRGVTWRRSGRCTSGKCVEIAAHRHAVGVRDSKVPEGPVLSFSRYTWNRFAANVKSGRFARP